MTSWKQLPIFLGFPTKILREIMEIIGNHWKSLEIIGNPYQYGMTFLNMLI